MIDILLCRTIEEQIFVDIAIQNKLKIFIFLYYLICFRKNYYCRYNNINFNDTKNKFNLWNLLLSNKK